MWPFKKKDQVAKIKFNVDTTGLELATKHAEELLKILEGINAEIDKIERRTPHDQMADAGVE